MEKVKHNGDNYYVGAGHDHLMLSWPIAGGSLDYKEPSS